ncbi:MAG TPA: hypothetical protein VHX62_00370 [Solirubrobacteraceae bacterium]|nr:hypothetical protein [Solirubrobacteraceae bacterium]
MTRRWLTGVLVVVGLTGIDAAVAEGWPGHQNRATLSVSGAVTAPTTYSAAQLAALPQTTFTVSRRRWRGSSTISETGVSLETLVNDAQPVLPDAKNALLRVTVTVAGDWGRRVTLALGELDPGFGNHPAYLALSRDGRALRAPELVIPGDSDGLRTVPDASAVSVAVQNPALTTPPAGAVRSRTGR